MSYFYTAAKKLIGTTKPQQFLALRLWARARSKTLFLTFFLSSLSQLAFALYNLWNTRKSTSLFYVTRSVGLEDCERTLVVLIWRRKYIFLYVRCVYHKWSFFATLSVKIKCTFSPSDSKSPWNLNEPLQLQIKNHFLELECEINTIWSS